MTRLSSIKRHGMFEAIQGDYNEVLPIKNWMDDNLLQMFLNKYEHVS